MKEQNLVRSGSENSSQYLPSIVKERKYKTGCAKSFLPKTHFKKILTRIVLISATLSKQKLVELWGCKMVDTVGNSLGVSYKVGYILII